jgi:hypothetical protein
VRASCGTARSARRALASAAAPNSRTRRGTSHCAPESPGAPLAPRRRRPRGTSRHRRRRGCGMTRLFKSRETWMVLIQNQKLGYFRGSGPVHRGVNGYDTGRVEIFSYPYPL